MLQYVCICLLCLTLSHSQAVAISLSQLSSYPRFCKEASENDLIFSNFKRDPLYRQSMEHVSYEQGLEYLAIIRKERPELLLKCDRFRENDYLGNPVIYNYSEIGAFSPTTLRYMKVASDLIQIYGNRLKEMQIVEIGGGYGGQCKILADAVGFAGYTLVDIPESNALSKKYLGMLGVENVTWIDHDRLDDSYQFDLVISNFAFSEIEKSEQKKYLEKIIQNAPSGYMTLNFILDDIGLETLSIGDLIAHIKQANREGKAIPETPLTHPKNLLLYWKPICRMQNSVLKDPNFNGLTYESPKVSCITYGFSGGRFGDNLVAYFHAKWAARRFGLPFFYRPFPLAQYLKLSEMDQPLNNPEKFKHHLKISKIKQILRMPKSTLIEVPYFPECLAEFELPHMKNTLYFPVDWKDPLFHKEVIECLTPKIPIPTIDLNPEYINVAMHVRRGGAYESFNEGCKSHPYKFPPDQFYIDALNHLVKIFKEGMIYVHIFTDDLSPESLAKNYEKQIDNPRIIFDWKKDIKDSPDMELLKDFYSMAKFDCLIRPESNLSIIAEKMGSFSLVISPSHATVIKNSSIVDRLNIVFGPNKK